MRRSVIAKILLGAVVAGAGAKIYLDLKQVDEFNKRAGSVCVGQPLPQAPGYRGSGAVHGIALLRAPHAIVPVAPAEIAWVREATYPTDDWKVSSDDRLELVACVRDHYEIYAHCSYWGRGEIPTTYQVSELEVRDARTAVVMRTLQLQGPHPPDGCPPDTGPDRKFDGGSVTNDQLVEVLAPFIAGNQPLG